MMKPSIKRLSIFLAILLSCSTKILVAQDAGYEQYKLAKEQTIAGEWNSAISEFQKMIDESPESNYHDDAFFWIAYSLEKIPGREIEAFMAFDKVSKKFPNSSWQDDAIIHQIDLATIFIKNGKGEYNAFIKKQSNSKNETISAKAFAALESINQKNEQANLEFETNEKDQIAMKSTYALEVNERVKLQESEDSFLFFPTERYKQYRKMLHNDNNWNKDELLDFGMWNILSEEPFSDYFALTGFDKKEWYRKFWALKDPTPTTEKNEALEEFEKRVLHSKAYFGNLVDYKHFKYLRDQDLRNNWFHAPWDARGELYIKYGEPDFSSIAGFRKVEWAYTSLNVDFIINKHMTNIYGNAIKPGPMSHFSYRFNLYELNARFIENSEFIYHHSYEKEPIDNGELFIKNKTFEYSIPQNEIESDDSDMKVFQQSYVVYDEDMHIVKHGDITQKIAAGNKTIQEQIRLDLSAGEYMLALRIEDLNSDKLGIYFETFKVLD